MEFLPGFCWPLPRAFAAAALSGRFEQGDVLYSDASAYGDWSAALEGRHPLAHCLLVLDPPRSARGAEGEGSRFDANWASPVQLEWLRPGKGERERLDTTQGRLFQCVWDGDPGWLDPTAEAPVVPLTARELHGRLEQALPRVKSAFRSKKALGTIYLFVLDAASDASVAKARAIEHRVAALCAEARSWSPTEAGIEDAARFHPALQLRGLRLTAPEEQAHEVLKSHLYGASVEGEADRFSLARHGLLVPIA